MEIDFCDFFMFLFAKGKSPKERPAAALERREARPQARGAMIWYVRGEKKFLRRTGGGYA